MKKTILLFGLFAGITGAGQNNDQLEIQKLIKDRQAKEKVENEKHKNYFPRLLNTQNLQPITPYILPNGDKVVYGTIDGMPIVQPDMRNFIVMPNVRVNINEFRTMPNPARKQFFSEGPNSIMDQLAPSPVLENLLKKHGK